ncbi:hypothetical protein FD755_017674 [Muntiacus reevesi]|uniref:Ubiquitin-like protein ATG12 n=1 Tax=Muntiacus reevesi TaxID=9886 RepID=A0A5N3XC80_MUNRE|nr:hypothetical protein FD755_017674 [Muntiacus reevesi]
MAEESALQLPPSTAPEAEGPKEVSPETATPKPPSSAAVSLKKISILLKAVGDTPIMKTKEWAVEQTRTIQGLIDFIKKFLKLVASEQLGLGYTGICRPFLNNSLTPMKSECFSSLNRLPKALPSSLSLQSLL